MALRKFAWCSDDGSLLRAWICDTAADIPMSGMAAGDMIYVIESQNLSHAKNDFERADLPGAADVPLPILSLLIREQRDLLASLCRALLDQRLLRLPPELENLTWQTSTLT